MTFVRCPLDADHVDAVFECGHRVHTDLTFGSAEAMPPVHECRTSGTDHANESKENR